jgi:hypothetical protein
MQRGFDVIDNKCDVIDPFDGRQPSSGAYFISYSRRRRNL